LINCGFYTKSSAWQQDILLTQSSCGTNQTWTGGSICSQSTSQSCFPAWDGVFTFYDLAPEGSVPLSLEFEIYGSFGCGPSDGLVNLALDGVGLIIIFHLESSFCCVGKLMLIVCFFQQSIDKSKYVFASEFNCGCGDPDSFFMDAPLDLNTTDWQSVYKMGEENNGKISADSGVNLCICGVRVIGTYWGNQGKELNCHLVRCTLNNVNSSLQTH
jgi:hypothetical protein